jgi:lipid-A-disaccharide synthase
MILGIVAGEASGDRLGAGLMAAVRRRRGDVRFIGVGGELMRAEGLECVAGMDRLAVNGFIEPVKRLPDLVGILRELVRTYARVQPDAFVGVVLNGC